MAWTLVIIGAIISYADIVLRTLEGFGIIDAPCSCTMGSPSCGSSSPTPRSSSSGIGLLLAASRKRLP